MKFYLIPAICLFVLIHSRAQTTDTIVLLARIDDSQEPMSLYRFAGFGYEAVQTCPLPDSGNTFVFRLPRTEPRFYYLGSNPQSVKPFLAGPEDSLLLVGNAKNPTGFRTQASPLNEAYANLLAEISRVRAEANELGRAYFSASDTQKDSLRALLIRSDERQLNLLRTAKAKDPFLGRVAALNTYLSYPNQGQQYGSELEYFAQSFFKYADLSDPAYADSPWMYQSFFQYAQVLSSANLEEDLHRNYLEAQLLNAAANTNAHQLAFSGALSALRQTKHPNFGYFAGAYINTFRASHPQLVRRLEAELARNRKLEPGSIAPDFSQLTPEGEPLALEDLRGQVVLIDFWASWCGPCRRENPNVVRMYKKFKDKGFAILGVSLDKQRDRWLKAIEQDGLIWHHVSDLKGWGNAVARQYQVNAIPQTFLLDRDGKILARNLRGAALEKKLEELFGSP